MSKIDFITGIFGSTFSKSWRTKKWGNNARLKRKHHRPEKYELVKKTINIQRKLPKESAVRKYYHNLKRPKKS